MKIILGKKYCVTDGSGVDSNRIGVVISPNHSYKFFKEIEPGRYKSFDYRREALLIDEQGLYFTMFKNRLILVD